MSDPTLIEICAGAGGQALGLEQAGFSHSLAVEIDEAAAATLRANLGSDRVREGDVADQALWNPRDHRGQVDLFAGGVPCPPFSIAGRQLGATDERDLFAWAIETVDVLRPRAVMLENVRGLSTARFAGYRQHVLDRLSAFGYVGDWRLLQASDYGVPQLRPRFVLVALQKGDAPFFSWPTPKPTLETVGSALLPFMEEADWGHARQWSELASGIAPTIVGGSKRHGGADLGPTRAKAAWRQLYVDGKGIADAPPSKGAPDPRDSPPRLTIPMVARLQGWDPADPAHSLWISRLAGRKTAQYRQVGNAFPPPVARAVGSAVRAALAHEGPAVTRPSPESLQDPIYLALRAQKRFVTIETLRKRLPTRYTDDELARSLSNLSRDFHVEVKETSSGTAFRLGDFRAFVGQIDHARHDFISAHRGRVS